MSNNELKQENREERGVDSLFDEFGRRIPPSPTIGAHNAVRRYFECIQPKIDYNVIHARISQYLQVPDTFSVREFEKRAERTFEQLVNDPAVKNITAGVGVPFFLPKISHTDIGSALDKAYLPAVKRSYKEKFPNYEFVNHNVENLSGCLNVTPGSRHELLLQKMHDEIPVGYFFPCLSEYSLPAAIAQMETLPDQFLLGGGFDICAAFIGCPELLFRLDGYPPLIWLAGVRGQKEQVGYHFEAYGYNLTFNRRAHLDKVAEYWSSGLTVLG